MKKHIFLLLFLLVLITNVGIAQVAKIQNELISDDEIILIGPLNVDIQFLEQSSFYISKYEKIIDDINLLITNLESELPDLINRRVKNKSKINQIINNIEKYKVEIELLGEFVLFWEEHSFNFHSYNNDLRQDLEKIKCYSFVVEGDTLMSSEVNIVEVKPKKELEYVEFIDGDYLEILKVTTRQEYDERKHHKKYIVKKDGSPYKYVGLETEFRMHTSNVLKKFESNKKVNPAAISGKFADELLDEDDLKLILRMEKLFSTFRFDKYDKEFYKERKYKNTDAFFQIWLKGTEKQIFPDHWFLSECD